VELAAEGHKKNGGLLRGVLDEVRGVTENFTISELDDRPDQLLVKSSLPLT
jgi:hypothetical protein